MRKICKNAATGTEGFTLIDVCVLLVVVSVLVAPVLKAVDIYLRDTRLGNTISNMQAADAALEQYYLLHGFYPCPANPALSEADPTYGQAVAPCDSAGDPDPATGGVPFKDIKIPVQSTLDGYKNKFTYAVSKAQTNSVTFPAGATLSLQFTRKDDTTTPPTFFLEISADPGHYVLISHGRNGAGGFSAAGIALDPCPVPPDLTLESENCDGDNLFLFHEYNVGDAPGPDYYDDRASFQEEAPTRIWTNSASDPTDIFSNAGLIGVGTDTPEVALDVEGNIRTVGGNANVTELCEQDVASPNCFEADVIGGTGMSCADAAEGMTGVSLAQANCNLAIPGVTGSCPGGFIVSINAGGTITCGP